MTKPWSVRTWLVRRNIAGCHLKQMPVKQMPIIVIYCISFTLYLYTPYTRICIYKYTHYIDICIHTCIYLTHIYIYIHHRFIQESPCFAIAPLFWLKILKWWIVSPQQTTPAETVAQYDWLVVDLPLLKNDGVRQLGWWHSQDMEKCSKPPIKWLYIWIVFPLGSLKKEGVLLGCVPASCSCFWLNSCLWCLGYA